jgi:serine/threonine-protein kinase
VSDFGPQSPERVVHILKQVAGALAEAHEVGLVHRDVKPANIILCERGRQLDTAKIVDFGLVKDLSGLGDPAVSKLDSVIGTPLYLAPEALLTPDRIDARADLYALGAVGYYLLTGTPVFSGATAIEVCAQHLQNDPEPPSVRLGRPLPERLEALLLRCLAKKPERRPQSAAALGTELESLGLAPWTQEQASDWWRGNQAKIEPHAKRRSRHSPVGSALTIDVAARVFHG